MESVGEDLSWRVRPGRARPPESALVLALTLLWFLYAWWIWNLGFALLTLVPLGFYLAGPLWVPVSYRIDENGVSRTTPFGAATHPWTGLGGYKVDRRRRAAWITRRGRGTARFLPPLLLLWEDREEAGFRERLEAELALHLGERLA